MKRTLILIGMLLATLAVASCRPTATAAGLDNGTVGSALV